MAVCGNCGASGTRIRSRWRGELRLPDECPACAPQSFEKFTMPSDQKIWMGYEAHPNEYVKGEDGGFDRKPEYRAEQEDRLALPCADDLEAQQRAERQKRAERRTAALSPSETLAALKKARIIAAAIEETVEIDRKQADEAELQSWIARSKQA